MSMTDPLADLLTRIRNANRIGRSTVDTPGLPSLYFSAVAALGWPRFLSVNVHGSGPAPGEEGPSALGCRGFCRCRGRREALGAQIVPWVPRNRPGRSRPTWRLSAPPRGARPQRGRQSWQL